ncbi:hypothetical protein MNBD_GAMMA12-2503 [hydrothermal vent metagenome]|uniref:CheW-like domain-containing protein n=1 Tax=hydrothermal vent metagenome TaxID=652676 RepID=A0A3B0ZLN0_9ZZZZ
MQLLTFNVDCNRYAIKTCSIREVLPVVKLMSLPFSIPGVTGLLNYSGIAVPVIDLTTLISGKPTKPLMSSRIVIINHQLADNNKRLLALLLEQATEIIRHDEMMVQDYGISMKETDFLGELIYDTQGVIQLVDPVNLLSATTHNSIFKTLDNSDCTAKSSSALK